MQRRNSKEKKAASHWTSKLCTRGCNYKQQLTPSPHSSSDSISHENHTQPSRLRPGLAAQTAALLQASGKFQTHIWLSPVDLHWTTPKRNIINGEKRNTVKNNWESKWEQAQNMRRRGRLGQEEMDRKEVTANMPEESTNRHRRDGIC